MDPYGNYSIYMLDIFGTFEATLIAYLLGVLCVLTIGMQSGALFNKILDNISPHPREPRKKRCEDRSETE